jgi:hypothetical protein
MRFRDKMEIMSQTSKLKGKNISINDDLLPEERKARAIFRAKRSELKSTIPSFSFTLRNDFLLVKNGLVTRKFTLDTNMKLIETTVDDSTPGTSRRLI